MNFKETSLEVARSNFEEFMKSDKVIIDLYNIAKQFDDDQYTPTCKGNFDAFVDINSDEWVSDFYDLYSSLSEDITIQAITENLRAEMVLYLKSLIVENVKYD